MVHRWRLAIVLAGFTSACQGAGLEAERGEREVWYSISDGEQAYGYMQQRVVPCDQAGTEHVVSSLLRIEVFGARQEIRTETRVVLEEDLTLRSAESETEQASGVQWIRVRPSGGGYVVEDERGQTTHTEPREGPPLIAGVALGDWLRRELLRGAAVGGPARPLRFFSEESGAVAEVTVRLVARDAAGSSWMLDMGVGWQETTLRIDRDGEMVEQRVSIPPYLVRRTSREEALAIDYRVTPDRELLVFPLDRELPPQRLLESLDVRLAWQEISPEEFQLEDARQRLVSLDEEEGRFTALVRLARFDDGGADAALPLPHAGFEAELASAGFILPADERIAAQAAEIVGTETSARAAARALCQWVNEFIRSEMIAETLSGPEVLERGVGKCTEYSTLYASLARAAGIPTRIALGQRRFSGAGGESWGGHMWNEVFVGEWVPVDASANEFGGSLDLLKFVHSDTVEGTQVLRWRLTLSLELGIADVKLRHAETGAAATGLSGLTYINAEFGFRFELPDATWTLEDRREGDALVLRLRPPDPDLGDAAMFHVTVFDYPPNVRPKLVLDARMASQRKALEEFEILRDEEAVPAGLAGHRLTFGGQPPGGQPLRVSEILLVHEDTGVLLNLIATPELHEQRLTQLEQTAASLCFLE